MYPLVPDLSQLLCRKKQILGDPDFATKANAMVP
jgi:hypothetical protein